MKLPRLTAFAVVLVAGLWPVLVPTPAAAEEVELKISLGDGWDGETVPADQVCQRFSGNGSTPPIVIANLPAGANSVKVAFNDESYSDMDYGGHGVIAFTVDGAGGAVTLPPVPGETETLPAGVKEVYRHQGEGWSGTGGSYLPPCSGGQGNTYTATVKAMGGADGDTVLGQGKVKLGVY